jgi:tripartite-type tricarboxylate transporter receptor subunit TctC
MQFMRLSENGPGRARAVAGGSARAPGPLGACAYPQRRLRRLDMRRLLAVVAIAAAAPTGAGAAEWPSKPVRLVVPFAAGGAADTIGRLYAEALSAAFSRQFYIENRVGGGGLVGTEAVARAEPDGLTLMVSGIPTHVLGPAMNKNAGFDPMRDFTHIGYFGGTPNVLVVHPSLGVTTYGDFLALARAGGGVEYVSAGFGTMGNWVAEFLAAREKIKLVHVAYKGGAQALLDLVGGHVKVGMLTWSNVAEAVRAGKLIPLAVTSAQRLRYLPDLPTLKELGHADFVATAWYSLSGPAGLPADIVESANHEVVNALERPQVKRQIEQDAIEVRAMTPAEVTRFMQNEIDRWTPMIRQLLGAKAQ